MRFVIDLQACQSESRFRGIGRYVMSLTKAMARLAKEGDDEVWLTVNCHFPEQIASIEKAFTGLITKNRIVNFAVPSQVDETQPRNAWRVRAAEMLREAFLRELEPDMVFVTSLFEGWGDDFVTSIGSLDDQPLTAVVHHDLIPFLHQDTYLADGGYKKFYFRKLASLKNAHLLLANSEHTRQDAISCLDIEPDRVVNISGAADSCFGPQSISSHESEEVLKRYRITKPFVLYSPGGFDSRKNIDRLIESYATLPEEILKRHQLVITSRIPKVVRETLTQHYERSGLTENDVVITDYVPDEHLVKLYNLCQLFVFPSLYEGFGLPVLEAMSCGAPTIGSNATSVVEVINRGDAMFDPTSCKPIRRAIYRALSDEVYREDLRKHALQQAKRFSWENSASRALAACRSLVLQERANGRRAAGVTFDRYQNLIDSLSKISTTIPPSEMDLVSTARSIAENEEIAAAFR